MYNPFSLRGKTILVTGASSGIGRATAIECSRLGAALVLTGRNEKALQETKEQLADLGNGHSIFVADLMNEDACEDLVSRLPLLDGFVSNAGIGKMLPLQFYSLEVLDEVFRINCFSPMLLLKLLVKRKRLKNNSSVVFTASISGYNNVAPANGIYGTSKSALSAYMKYAALELAGKGIRCNAVHPGRINTPLISNRMLTEEDVAKDVEQYPLKRYGEPSEVAHAIIYLLSDAASWVTGTNLVIDGGRSLEMIDMERFLENKVCIITGAAQGIGKSIAERFASDGALVYACDRAEGVMDEWAKACSEKYGTRVCPLYFDVTDAVAVKSAFMSVFKQERRIDVLVNNAGVVFNKKIGMILRPETELMFRVNVIAVIEMVQLVSRLMARGHGGSIVNIASVTAVLGSPGQSAYSATKGAIIAFTKSAAKELASQGIRVNAVAPGIVKTERFSELYEESGEKIDNRIQRIALGRLGTPLDVANACAFLASDRSSYISGQILGVDGCASI